MFWITFNLLVGIICFIVAYTSYLGSEKISTIYFISIGMLNMLVSYLNYARLR